METREYLRKLFHFCFQKGRSADIPECRRTYGKGTHRDIALLSIHVKNRVSQYKQAILAFGYPNAQQVIGI
jgi:hypothetical protein